MNQVSADVGKFVSGSKTVCVVKAPPGSGKTFTLLESLAVCLRARQRVMIAAQTNNQVDELCNRFCLVYPKQHVIRFSSSGYVPTDLENNVEVCYDKNQLPDGPSIVVSTVAKIALTKFLQTYDILFVDEAWQMAWADFLAVRVVANRYVLIGDPGQIPPTVSIEVDRWETSPFPPHGAAPEVLLGHASSDEFLVQLELGMCRRLPADSVEVVNLFYDFSFTAQAKQGERFLRASRSRKQSTPADTYIDDALTAISGLTSPHSSVILSYPTPVSGLPVGTDLDLADIAAQVAIRLLDRKCLVSTCIAEQMHPRPLTAGDIGIVSTHNEMNAAIERSLRQHSQKLSDIRVTTPERWQGLERAVMIVVHPLSGIESPSGFDLETGRLCVMASRHQAACIFLTRDHVGETLKTYLPHSDQALGRFDAVGRGHFLHQAFWHYHEKRNLIV